MAMSHENCEFLHHSKRPFGHNTVLLERGGQRPNKPLPSGSYIYQMHSKYTINVLTIKNKHIYDHDTLLHDMNCQTENFYTILKKKSLG